MNKQQLDEANRLYENFKLTDKFKDAINDSTNYRVIDDTNYANIEVNGTKYKITAVTHQKILDLLTSEKTRYYELFDNYMKN